jgi:CRP/FNR family cyclic AMP-dependent transcriptional regulator
MKMLEDIDMFAGLSSEELKTLESYITARTYRRNTIVVEKGDEASSLYVLISGKAKAYIADESGKEIVLSVIEPGEYFGELALLGEPVRTASVMTLADSKLAIISKAAFMQCLSSNPNIAINIIGGLIRRINYLTEKVSDLGLKDVYGRVVSLLQRISTEEDGKRVTDRVTQQQIADEVGSSREMVSRILKDLKRGAYVSVDHGIYTIKKNLPAKW